MAKNASSQNFCAKSTPSMSVPSATPVGCTVAAIEWASPSTVELHTDGFGDEGRAGRPFDLDRVFRGDAHAALDRIDRFDLLAQSDARSGRDLPGKPDSVRTVVEAARAVLDAVDRLPETRHQR